MGAEAKNCWEFWNCARQKTCPVSRHDMGRECFTVSSLLNSHSPFCEKEKEFGSCIECPWYKTIKKI